MNAPSSGSSYALGYSQSERDRLIRQAAQLAPLTERFFRHAGIGPGHRVLELGSGMGDVAMLVARIVGPSGEVVGVERDADSIQFAQSRVSEAGLHNVTFTQSDISQLSVERKFDAAVGRFILQFIPDVVPVLRSLAAAVRPGGILAFHEPQWQPYLDLLRPLPLSLACATAVRDTMRATGIHTDQGLSLHRLFQDAGLPIPNIRVEMIFGSQPGFTTWVCDLLFSLLPKATQHNVPLAALGDLATLSDRVHAEVTSACVAVPWIAMVGVSSNVWA